MTREHLYRGKRTDNGEWVYGDLVHYGPVLISIIGITIDDTRFNYDVDPATVGQFTGVHDMEGEIIFEGDVVALSMSDNTRSSVVAYRNGAFIVEADGFFGTGEFDISAIGWAIDELDSVVVTGNIHDNPELLNQ